MNIICHAESCLFTGPTWYLTRLAMAPRRNSENDHVARRLSCIGWIEKLRAAAHQPLVVRGLSKTVGGSEGEQKLTLHSVAVFGNTTCPASDLAMTRSHLDALNLIQEQYGAAISPFHLCPPPLFAEIIKINHLRKRGTKYEPTSTEDLLQEAYEIHRRVHGFSSEQWAKSKPLSKEDWMLTGNTYQVAVKLYCISSLQGLSILPATPSLRAQCTKHGRHLQVLLNEALSSPQIKRFMIWPLVLLGVEAVNGGAAMRAFVVNQLSELSRDVGTYAPLTARGVLESFWASGETCWDTCFDRPYIFTTQIAVDTSRILPFS